MLLACVVFALECSTIVQPNQKGVFSVYLPVQLSVSSHLTYRTITQQYKGKRLEVMRWRGFSFCSQHQTKDRFHRMGFLREWEEAGGGRRVRMEISLLKITNNGSGEPIFKSSGPPLPSSTHMRNALVVFLHKQSKEVASHYNLSTQVGIRIVSEGWGSYAWDCW